MLQPDERSSGIVLHISSLPGRFGIGDLGPAAHSFLRFLRRAGQNLWQTLPLGPTGYGNSPYASYSAFAGNHLFISPEILHERAYLYSSELLDVPNFSAEQVDFDKVAQWKDTVFRSAFTRFRSQAAVADQQEFIRFCDANADWLEDYALFMALKQAHGGSAWNRWPEDRKLRRPAALEAARIALDDECFYHKFLQFEFQRQWKALRSAAEAAGIRLIGDLPIFLNYDSADVWAGKSLFRLHPDGAPEVVSGVPPDYFSETGQRWGNPHYNWAIMRMNGFAWWQRRIARMLEWFHQIRIDHFRGFVAAWEIAAEEKTAVNGHWVDAPGKELFSALQQKFGKLPFIAEDLGTITPEVHSLRESFGLPGMKVLQFAFESRDPANEFLPHNFEHNCVVYTGTHDNDTTKGWFAKADKATQNFLRQYLPRRKGRSTSLELIRAALASPARMCLIPMQDVLNQGSERRMNFPGKAAGNWGYRCRNEELSVAAADTLAAESRLFNRGISGALPNKQTAAVEQSRYGNVPHMA